jgi:hypothetical protein
MAIFTAAATFLLAGTFLAGSAIATGALAIGLGLATQFALSYAIKAISGNRTQPAAATDHFGVQGALAGGGDVPRGFPLGYSLTAGSLVYANTYGGDTDTPNAYLAQVIAVSDLPGPQLRQVWVSGELCTLDFDTLQDVGYPVLEYRKDGRDRLWINYYDGTQTEADPHLVSEVSSEDRPYESTRVGIGVAYVIATSLVDDTLFTGFPSFKFALSSVPLYDVSKDSTAGGSGPQRYGDPSTWGGDGDDFPVVQTYNVLKGFYYNGIWLYGLQNMVAARLPAVNWITQIEKCRAPIAGADGDEPTYRSGLQLNFNTQPANLIPTLMTACQGRVSEIAGFFKCHVGAPDSPSFSFTDDDILSSEPQTFRPFFALADSVNGIQGTYPDPSQGWSTATAPAYYRADLEARDGNRRLMANPAFDAVPYPAQVQRLQKSAIEEGQRARSHVISLPPAFWIYAEPGEVGAWTSARNGYVNKQVRVDGATDKANLDVPIIVTEVDPSDYDPPAFIPLTTGPTVMVRPAPQGVVDWAAEQWTLPDSSGIGRKPAIRLSWDGILPGVVGVQYEVRLAEDGSDVTRGRTDQLAAGAIIVSQSLIPDEDYEVRGQYLPSSPRDMLWSDWLEVTTPDVRLSSGDVDDAIRYNISTLQGLWEDRFLALEQQFATLASTYGALSFTDTQKLSTELVSRAKTSSALVTRVQQVSTSADAALASDISTLTATVAGNTASIVTNATAISTLNGSFASFSTSVTASLGSLSSSVTTNSTAIAGIGAQTTTNVDVNGYVVGTKLINGGAGLSKFVVLSDKVQFQHPAVNGGVPVDLLTIGVAGGFASMVFAGNFTADGYVLARMIGAGQVKTAQLDALSVSTTKLQVNSVDIKTGHHSVCRRGTGGGRDDIERDKPFRWSAHRHHESERYRHRLFFGRNLWEQPRGER